MLIELNEHNFYENISNGINLVEFYASWCGYCIQQNEILKDMTEIKIYKINGDLYPSIARKYGINSYPSFIIFLDGKVVRQFSGLHTKFELMNILIQYIK